MAFSRNITVAPTPKVLPPLTLLQVVVVVGILLSCSLAHLALRFQLGAVRRETNQLQALQSTLASEVKGLQGRTAALTQDKKLIEYARNELGMVPYRPEIERKVVVVRPDVNRRYELARAESQATRRPAAAVAGAEPWFDKYSDRLGLISQAVARERKPQQAEGRSQE